jgi:DNA-directed RNA polymerase
MFVQSRIKEAYYNEVVHTDMNTFLREQFTDVGLIDLFLRLKRDLDEEKRCEGYFSGDEQHGKVVRDRLHNFLEQILAKVPENLRGSLVVSIGN